MIGIILVILLLIWMVCKCGKREKLTAIDWRDATTIGQNDVPTINYKEDKLRGPVLEFKSPSEVYKQELEYQDDEVCRNKIDDSLAKITPRRPLKNEGNAFVKGLLSTESFESTYNSIKCNEVPSRKVSKRDFSMTPKSVKSLYET